MKVPVPKEVIANHQKILTIIMKKSLKILTIIKRPINLDLITISRVSNTYFQDLHSISRPN